MDAFNNVKWNLKERLRRIEGLEIKQVETIEV
jgi:hypothetical protein